MSIRSEVEWRAYREMGEELRTICVEAVRTSADLPSGAKECSEAVGSVKIGTFDQSYVEFLDRQIKLEPRGEEWAERLRRRRESLAAHVQRELADCRLKVGDIDYWIVVDPIAHEVVHFESYDE